MTTRNALPMDPEKLVEGVTGLITLPEAALEVNRLADDPKSTAEDIARVVSRDPVLATQLLRIVNSASYGLMRRVDTITRAVTLFGTGQIRDLAIGLSVARSFNGIPSELITPQSFWNHSLLTALSAQMVAKQCIPGRGEVVFVAGLLHDIGRLVLFNREPERSYEALLMSIDMPGEPELWRCEREVFGTDHAAVGAALGRRWHLPASLVNCIAYHHEPMRAENHRLEAAIIHISTAMAEILETGTTDVEDLPPIERAALELTRLDLQHVVDLCASAGPQVQEIREVFHLTEQVA